MKNFISTFLVLIYLSSCANYPGGEENNGLMSNKQRHIKKAQVSHQQHIKTKPSSGHKNTLPNQRNSSHSGDALKSGMSNLGNTCFANATTSMLLASKSMHTILANKLPQFHGEDAQTYSMRENFRDAFFKLSQARDTSGVNLSNQLNKYFDAYEKAALRINGTTLVGGVIDGVQLRSGQGDAMALLQDILIFLGYAGGGDIQFNYNIFTDNSIKTYPDGNQFVALDIHKSAPLAELYKDWTNTAETMTGSNRVYNAQGIKMDSVKYQTLLSPSPETLIFALKRFDISTGVPKKVSTPVNISKNLVVQARSKNNINNILYYDYKLKSIAIHYGTTGGGHYIAYVFEPDANRWIKYNDSQVAIVSEKEVEDDARTNGYLFLYER